MNSHRTFDVFIHQFHNKQAVDCKKCIYIGTLSELEQWFDKEENIVNTLSSGTEKFCFELVSV